MEGNARERDSQQLKRIVEKETFRVIAWSHHATYLFP
jgi:hypothetical protein